MVAAQPNLSRIYDTWERESGGLVGCVRMACETEKAQGPNTTLSRAEPVHQLRISGEKPELF